MKVVGYCRFSSEGQRDGYSIEAQSKAIEEFCAASGYDVLRYYIDEARSGTSDDRESFQDMIADASSGKFQAVVVHKLDRFARDRYDSAIYKKKLKDNGVRLISVVEPLDDSPESIMMESVLEGMAEYYSRNLAREIVKGKRVAASKALYTGGGVTYGYRIGEDKRYYAVPEEFAIVKEIFKLIDSGLSLAEVSRTLNSRGLRNRQGTKFLPNWIATLIANPMYKGTFVYGRRAKSGQDLIVIEDAVPAAVDNALFLRVNNRAAATVQKHSKKRPVARNRGDFYILTGYIYCDKCGLFLNGYTSTQKYNDRKYSYQYYRCSRRHHYVPGVTNEAVKCNLKHSPKEATEDFVIRAIESIIFSAEALDHIVCLVRERLSTRVKTDDDKEVILKTIKELKGKRDRLLDLYLAGSLDIPSYNKHNSEINKAIEYHSNKLLSMNYIDPESITTGIIKEKIEQFIKSEKADTLEYKKLLLSTFVDSISINNEEIVIYFKFQLLPNSLDAYRFVRNDSGAITHKILRTNIILKVSYPLELIHAASIPENIQIVLI